MIEILSGPSKTFVRNSSSCSFKPKESTTGKRAVARHVIRKASLKLLRKNCYIDAAFKGGDCDVPGELEVDDEARRNGRKDTGQFLEETRCVQPGPHLLQSSLVYLDASLNKVVILAVEHVESGDDKNVEGSCGGLQLLC